MVATINSSYRIVQALLKSGVDVEETRPGNNVTALWLACDRKGVRMVETLADATSDQRALKRLLSMEIFERHHA
jgi:hypothetical protein